MSTVIRLKVIVWLMLCTVTVSAQDLKAYVFGSPDETLNNSYLNLRSGETNGDWYSYFKNDFSKLMTIGCQRPVVYDCAIKINAESVVYGKRVFGLKFALPDLKNIKNVKIWMSNTLPVKADSADIICYNVPDSMLVSYPESVIKVPFPIKYQMYKRDVYFGYTFEVQKCDTDSDKFPIFTSGGRTYKNTLLIKFGESSWGDYAGNDFGALALSVYMDNNFEYITGDVNYDNVVNVEDANYIIRYLLTKNTTHFNFKAADVDKNDSINIVDAASVVDIILEKYKAPEETKPLESAESLVIDNKDNAIGVSVTGDELYKALQMDVTIPCDDKIEKVIPSEKLTKTHSISFKEIEKGKYRIIVYSIGGYNMNSDKSALFNIETTAKDVKIDNIIFATSDLREMHITDVRTSDVTGIDNVNVERNTGVIYSVYGVKVNKQACRLDKGVYIINGRKVIIK